MDKNLVAFFVIGCLLLQVNSLIEFTNLICESVDKSFADFEYCHLKTVNRSYKYITAKALLFKKPVEKVRINGALYKRSNSYRPFLYNVTVDGCKFFAKIKTQPVAQHVCDLLSGFSNINHTCPYNHDLYVNQLTANYLNNRLSQILTFPKGDYLFQTHWIAYGINRVVIKLYFSLK